MLKRGVSFAATRLLWVLLGLLNGAAHAQEAEVARKKCVDFGFQPNTNQHAECVKLKFLPPKAEFLLSNSRKRGSAFCLRFDLINQFDGAFLPYR